MQFQHGILIFDDYKINNIEDEFFNQILSIDSFIKIFESQLKVLYSGYQYIVQKKYKKNNINNQNLISYNDLLNEINQQKPNYFYFSFNEKIKEDFEIELKISKKYTYIYNR